jgi:transcription initiation factor TFIID subunit 2
VDDRIVAFGASPDLDFVSRAMLFYTTEFGTYPYQDFKIAFVHDLPAIAVYACVVFLPFDCDTSVIEASIELRETLALALARQWIGINIIPRDLSDTWIVNGIALHIRALCLRHIFGNNDYRYRLKKDIDRCVRLDQGAKAPICVPGSANLDLDFINLKAPLVLHILDRHLAKTNSALGLPRIIPRIFLSALSDELGIGNSLSTSQFFRICRRVTSLDLTHFADTWVFGSECPHFKINANFVRKKFQVELTVQAKNVEGSLTVRIHEADGAPFEHVLDIKQPIKTYNLPFNTKYKRTRRSGKVAARFEHLQQELEADEDMPAELFSYPPWDEEEVRREWKVGEWSTEQADAMVGEGGGYEWIRIDPECEWLAWFEFPERPWYWVSQMQGDKDVAAQIQVSRQAVPADSVYPKSDESPDSRCRERAGQSRTGQQLLLPRANGSDPGTGPREYPDVADAEFSSIAPKQTSWGLFCS